MNKLLITAACIALAAGVAGCEKKKPIAHEHDTTPSDQVVDSAGMVYTDLQGHAIGTIEAEVDAAKAIDKCEFGNGGPWFDDPFYSVRMTCPDNAGMLFVVRAAEKYAHSNHVTLLRVDPTDESLRNYTIEVLSLDQ